jgi:NADP-dependent 3-hydroxy acid dehydrogenase YdfG
MASTENLPLQVIQLDVNDDSSVKDAIYKIVKEKERIDVLVNNAGYGLFGSLEDISLEEIKAQFETNFFGVIRVTQLVLPLMREQKSGTIVNVSSVGGAYRFSCFVCVSKYKVCVRRSKRVNFIRTRAIWN